MKKGTCVKSKMAIKMARLRKLFVAKNAFEWTFIFNYNCQA